MYVLEYDETFEDGSKFPVTETYDTYQEAKEALDFARTAENYSRFSLESIGE